MSGPAATGQRPRWESPVSLLAAHEALKVLYGAPGPMTAGAVARALRARGIVVATGALERGLRTASAVEVLPGQRVRFQIGESHRHHPVDLPGSRTEPRDAWTDLFDQVASGLFDVAVDAVVVDVLDPAKITSLLRIRMDRVLVGVPRVAVAVPLAGAVLARAVAHTGFDCWPWPWQVRLGQRSELGSDAVISRTTPALGVACENDPRAACTRVRELLQVGLEITDLERVSVGLQRCEDAEEMRRLREIEGLPHRRAHGGGTSRAPAVSTCERCGAPLSDPHSVAVGVGPECEKYYDRTMLQRIRNHPKVEPRSWIGLKTSSTWLAEIRTALVTA